MSETKEKQSTTVDWKVLVGETIIKIEEIDSDVGFWGDLLERIKITCKSGNVFYLQTDGGSNSFMGFPGSQIHSVSLEKETLPLDKS